MSFSGYDPTLPHALCHARDGMPFEKGSIRTSEIRSIIALTIANHAKAEYNHLDTFGVCIIETTNRRTIPFTITQVLGYCDIFLE